MLKRILIFAALVAVLACSTLLWSKIIDAALRCG